MVGPRQLFPLGKVKRYKAGSALPENQKNHGASAGVPRTGDLIDDLGRRDDDGSADPYDHITGFEPLALPGTVCCDMLDQDSFGAGVYLMLTPGVVVYARKLDSPSFQFFG